MAQKNISGWDDNKQKMLNEIKARTGDCDSEAIRQALGFHLLFLDITDKYRMMVRVNRPGRPKKPLGRPKKNNI